MSAEETLKRIIEVDMPRIMKDIATNEEWGIEYSARLMSDANTALQMLKILANRMKAE